MSEIIYASDLMSEVRENPEKYEGKRYKVDCQCFDANGREISKVHVVNGDFRSIETDFRVFFGLSALLQEIKPEPKPEPKPVTFEEAIKALSESKTIKCIIGDYERIYEPFFGMLMSKDGALITCHQILSGTWYIIDEN